MRLHRKVAKQVASSIQTEELVRCIMKDSQEGKCDGRVLMQIMPNFKDGDTYLRFKCYEYDCKDRHNCRKKVVKSKYN